MVKITLNETRNILELRGITKAFPGVVALNGVDLEIAQGEAHALLGENGAGKSSLIKVLCGIYLPDAGEMRYAGAPYAPHSPHDAIRAGIRVVYQEFNLLSFLSVAENIFFDKLPRKAGLVDFRTLYREAGKLLEMVGLDISPKTPVEMLGVAQMQLIEIAKALSSQSKVLILDEPTATLTSKEIETLFTIIKRLQSEGVTIIYVSHRLQEIFEICDRFTVLRNGAKVGTQSLQGVTVPEIVKMMVGRTMEEEYPFETRIQPQEVIFQVNNLKSKSQPHEVSFSLRKGELLGVAGLVGSGRTETMRAIFGADPKESGTMYLRGEEIQVRRPKDAVQHGICLLTEDRKNQGLILDMPCYMNVTLSDLAQVSKSGLLSASAEKSAAEKFVQSLAIKTPSVNQWARNLSGGNQQKVVLAKWLFRNADILIFDEPTRGIDVGAKYEIYVLLWELAAQGKGMIIVSSDLPELLGICHRIIVFSNGKIAGEVERRDFDQERILSLAYTEYVQHHDQRSKTA